MDRFGLRAVELRVRNARAGSHPLQLSGANYCARADAVLVFEGAREHPRKNLHVAVRMRPESGARRDAILVNYPQRAKAHEAPIVIITEGKRVPTVKPAKISSAALLRKANGVHRLPPLA